MRYSHYSTSGLALTSNRFEGLAKPQTEKHEAPVQMETTEQSPPTDEPELPFLLKKPFVPSPP